MLTVLVFTDGPSLVGAPDQAPKFSWPVVRGTPPALAGITSTFGESRDDHFHNGVDIAAHNAGVRPVARGRFLFVRNRADDPFRPEPGPGNVVILEHKNGWRSGYFHLRSAGAGLAKIVEKNSILGIIGNSGRSRGAHLHFFVIEPNGDYINPMTVLPGALDKNPPVIGQLSIFAGGRRTRISHSRQENVRLSRRFPVYISVLDPGLERSSRRGVFRLSWQLNGGSVQTRTFDRMQFGAGRLRLRGEWTFEQTFGHGLYLLGPLEFSSGDNKLSVTAQDHAGNRTTRVFEINVRTNI